MKFNKKYHYRIHIILPILPNQLPSFQFYAIQILKKGLKNPEYEKIRSKLKK